MQCFETIDHLDSNFPQLVFSKFRFALLTLLNLLEEVPIISIFHDDTQIWTMQAIRWRVVNKCFIILNYILVVFYTCEDSDFVNGIFSFFVAQTFDNSNFFQRINEPIMLSNYLKHCRITAFSQLLKYFEIINVTSSELRFNISRRFSWYLLRMSLFIPCMIKIRQIVVNWTIFY